MPGISWGEMFSWRPSFRSLFGAPSRTGSLANNKIVENHLCSQHNPSRLLEEARSLPVLSAAAAVGLEILLHDVNVDEKPGVVTRANLHAALANLSSAPEADIKDDLVVVSCQDDDFQSLSHLILEEEGEEKDEETDAQLVPTRSYDQKKPSLSDLTLSFKSASLPDSPDWSQRSEEGSEIFVTCPRMPGSIQELSVPDSHAWGWYGREVIDVFNERTLGRGTFARVYSASIAFFDSNREYFTVRSVAVKVFTCKNLTLKDVIYEADVSAFMASIGVGPETIGLLKPSEEVSPSLPSLMMVYIEGSMDLITLFTGKRKPARIVIIDILIQAARLLAHIHSFGFLHNDIKSCNMIATPNPQRFGADHLGVPPPDGVTGELSSFSQYRVYLIDYGQSTYRRGAVYHVPASERHKLGRYPYLPPEVFDGTPTSVSSEVYSLGIVMKASSVLLKDLNLQKDLSEIVKKCLSPSPSARPSLDQIEGWLVELLPPDIQSQYFQVKFSDLTPTPSTSDTTIPDNCSISQGSALSTAQFPSSSSSLPRYPSSDFEIRVVQSTTSNDTESTSDMPLYNPDIS